MRILLRQTNWVGKSKDYKGGDDDQDDDNSSNDDDDDSN